MTVGTVTRAFSLKKIPLPGGAAGPDPSLDLPPARESHAVRSRDARARAMALPPALAAQLRAVPEGASAPLLAHELIGGLSDGTLNDQERALLLELLRAHGYDVESLGTPAADDAVADLKRRAGAEPTPALDLELLLALLGEQIRKDRAAESVRRARMSVGSRAHAPSAAGPTVSASRAHAAPLLERAPPIDVSGWRPGKGDVTPQNLVRIAAAAGHALSAERARQVAPHLNRAMAEAKIDTPQKKAAFVAQLMHESASFRYREEIASGAAYEGRRDLGNTQPGDGERFKGRGFIQLTGRANYAAASRALGEDFVKHPARAATDEQAARVAAWFWNSRGLGALAQRGQFDEVTRRINGGFNGKADRDRLHAAARAELKDCVGLPATGAPAGTGGGASRLTRVALDWAENVRVNPNNGQRNWSDYCLAFVDRVAADAGYDHKVPGGPSALASYQAARAQGLTRTDWSQHRGDSILYWGNGRYGHIAIATDKIGPDGKPMVLHTGSASWGEFAGARLFTWTETQRMRGHPTAYVPVG